VLINTPRSGGISKFKRAKSHGSVNHLMTNQTAVQPRHHQCQPRQFVQYAVTYYIYHNVLLKAAKLMISAYSTVVGVNTPYKHTSSVDPIRSLHQSTPSVSPSSSSPSSASDTFSPKSFSRCLYFSHLSSKSPNTIKRSSSSL
jgi:hypothetical protein